jgi:membrane protease YdiL (CAAX protease family)
MNRIRTFLASVSAPEAAPPWSLMTVIITVVFAFIAMIIGVGVVYAWDSTRSGIELIGWTLGGLLVILFVRQTRRKDWDALRLAASSTPILFVMFVSLGVAIALDLLSLALTHEFFPGNELQYLNPKALGVVEWVSAIAFMVIVEPIAEELIFRGIMLPALRTKLGVWRSIVWTATISGGFHMLLYPINATSLFTPLWYGLLIPIIEAVIFGMVRNSTHSTRAAIAAHVAFGLFAVVKLLTLAG